MNLSQTLLRPWSRWLSGNPVESELHEVRSLDGLRLALHRIPGDGPAVMLLHGLGCNSNLFLFPDRSLAQWLSDAGYDVYVPDLRGAGSSERAGLNWGLEEYLQLDLPPIIDEILRLSGKDRLSWVGHSMGGILLFCYGMLHPDAPISSGLAIASALDYRLGDCVFGKANRFKSVLSLAPAFPFGTLIHYAAPLLGRPGPGLLESPNLWRRNLEPELIRRLHAICFDTIPMSLMLSLATTFEDSGLRLRDGTRFLDLVGRFHVPLQLFAGSRDQQCSVEAVRDAGRMLGASKELRIFGRDMGQLEEYGHCDLVIGRNAPWEVWPEISSWLEASDPQRKAEESSAEPA